MATFLRYRERQKEQKENKPIFEEVVQIKEDAVEPVPSSIVDQIDPLTPQMRQIVRAAVRTIFISVVKRTKEVRNKEYFIILKKLPYMSIR